MARKSRITGVSRLRRKLRRFDKAVLAEIREVVAEGGELIRNEAIKRVPVKTGNLRDVLRHRSAVAIRGDRLSVKVGVRTKSLMKRGFYAMFVEFGTKSVPARPFLVPAFKATLPLLVRWSAAAINRAVNKVALR